MKNTKLGLQSEINQSNTSFEWSYKDGKGNLVTVVQSVGEV